MSRSERGQVLPLVALLMVLAGVAAVGLVRLGTGAAERARAVTAADAAALAGAADDEDRARELAQANGGELNRFEREGPDARVRVHLGDAVGTARARRTGGRGHETLAPALVAALGRVEQLLGGPVAVGPGSQGLVLEVPAGLAERLSAVASGAGLCRVGDGDPVQFTICGAR